MGRKLPQNLTSTAEQLDEEQDSRLKIKKHRRKGKKRGSEISVEDTGLEDESALTLLQLRQKAVDASSLLADDIAASSQLILENASCHHKVFDAIGKEKSKTVGNYKRHDGRRKKKRKRQHSEIMDEEGSDPMNNSAEDPPAKKLKRSHKTILSLDDIDSQDDDVALYLREYENDAENHISAHSSQQETIESASQMQQLAATVDHQTFDSLKQSTDKLPSSSSSLSRRKRHKKKDNVLPNLGLHLDPNYINDQEPLEGTGQPRIDYAAFDKYFTDLPLSSNAHDQASDNDVPLDPQLPSETDMVFEHQDNLKQRRAGRRKSQRVYSAQKQKSRKELSGGNLHALPQDEPSQIEERQLGKILPSVENTESHSSSGNNLSEASDRQSEVSNGQSEASDRQLENSNEQPEILSRQSEISNEESDLFIGQSESHSSSRNSLSEASDRQSEVSNGQSEASDRPLENSNKQPEILSRQSEISDGESDLFIGQSESASPYTNEVQPEKTPPPLQKPSKPRGNKKQQGGKKSKNYNPSLTHIAEHGGMFKASEIDKLDNFRDSYCQEEGLTYWQFNELIHVPMPKRRRSEIWTRLHNLVSYRTRMSVMRFCRRRYHNYSARGTWTNSEDESLKQAVEEKGPAWKAVGDMIGRFSEDCRDRYRNYIVNAEKRNSERWTEAEVKNLCRAVHDTMAAVKTELRNEKEEKYAGKDIPESEPESDPEVIETKLIHWASVSNRMGPGGGGRSRLQCAHKWARLKTEERRKYWNEVRAAIRGRKPIDNNKSPKSGWRLRSSLKKMMNMKAGDRHDFLQAFATCGASQADNIPWILLGDEQFQARWTTSDRKAAWIIFKSEVPGGEDMDYRDLVNRLLTKLMAEDGDKLEERWDPAVHGDISVPPTRGLRRKRKEQAELQKRLNAVVVKGKIKSKEIVTSSEDEDEAHVNSYPSEEAGESGNQGRALGVARSAASGELPDSEVERQYRDDGESDAESEEDDHEEEGVEGEEEEEEGVEGEEEEGEVGEKQSGQEQSPDEQSGHEQSEQDHSSEENEAEQPPSASPSPSATDSNSEENEAEQPPSPSPSATDSSEEQKPTSHQPKPIPIPKTIITNRLATKLQMLARS